MAEQQKQSKETLDAINKGVQLKKVDAPAERKLPTAEEIAAAKKLAEEEGHEIDPNAHPKSKDGRSMLELIKDGDVKLKKVDTKEPALPTAEQLAEEKRLQQEGK